MRFAAVSTNVACKSRFPSAPGGFFFPSPPGPPGPFPPYLPDPNIALPVLSPCFFTGLKLRPPGIGIEAPVVKEVYNLLSDVLAAKQSVENVESSNACFQVVIALEEKIIHL